MVLFLWGWEWDYVQNHRPPKLPHSLFIDKYMYTKPPSITNYMDHHEITSKIHSLSMCVCVCVCSFVFVCCRSRAVGRFWEDECGL